MIKTQEQKHDMVRLNNIANYYKNTSPHYHRFFKEVFIPSMTFEGLKNAVEQKAKMDSQWKFLDSVFLFEAITFLRLSLFSLLSYKHLICGKHLPMSKVALYYSYFYVINCFLRLRGKAVIHVQSIPERIFDDEPPKQLVFQLIQHEDHTFSLDVFRQNEHQFIWDDFHSLYPELSSRDTGRLFRQDRYDWNYGLLYPSQATDEFAQQEIRNRCENNFLDPQFENANSSEEAEYKQNLIADYGHEEMYAGDLIKEGIKLFVLIGKESNHKSKYVELLTKIKNDMDAVESSESIKNEIKKWLDDATTEIDQSN